MFRKCLALLFTIFVTLVFSTALPAKTKIGNKSIDKITLAEYPALQNELFAMRVLRQIYAAQATYYSTVGNGRFASGIQLLQANLIDNDTAVGVKYGYFYSIGEVSGPVYRFVAVAIPYRYGKTGKRSFYIDSGCKLRGANKNGQVANAGDPLIETCTATLAYENEKKTIAAMRALHSAQVTYQSTAGAGDFGNLTQLHFTGLINSTLASGVYGGSAFIVTVTAQSPSLPAFYKAQSIPMLYGETGFRSFYIDVGGILRGADKNGASADANDPPIEEFSEQGTDK
jgi:hypothetical protein